MNNQEKILNNLRTNKQYLTEKYRLLNIAIFGSVSRNEDNKNSDIDIIVDFSEPIGIEFIDLADELELLLRQKVDLVSKNGIKDKYFKAIEKDLIYV